MVLLGDAGVGKSRLLRELAERAASAGHLVLEGRSIDSGSGTPLRPFVEVLLAAWTAGCDLSTPELVPFRAVLGPLVPESGIAGPAEAPPLLVIAEAVRRVLADLAADRPVVVLLEDLHWADDETLEITEFLADRLVGVPVLVVATVRTGVSTAAASMVERLARRTDVDVIPVEALGDDEVRAMIRLVVGSPDPPPALTELVVANADGVPLFVEELLASALAGTPERVESWTTSGRYRPTVPAAFARSVRDRVDHLAAPAPEVLRAASLVGRELEVELVAEALDVPLHDVEHALAGAREVELVDHGHAGVLRFRHALSREAIRSGLLATERRRLAGALAGAVQSLHPELAGPWCTLAARLRQEAGDAHEAATLLLESARRAAKTGALDTASALLDEALRSAEGDLAVTAAVQEQQLDVLALQGRCDDVFRQAPELLRTLDALGSPTISVAATHLRTARAAVHGELWTQAVEELDAVAAVVGNSHPEVAGEAEVLRAHIDLARGDLDHALARAEHTLRLAENRNLPELQCEALEIVGRVHRTANLAAAAEAFERGLAVATRNALHLWRARALHEVATVEVFRMCGVRGFQRALEAAHAAGAPRLACAVDSHLASAHITRFEPDRALPYAQRSLHDARALGVAPEFTTVLMAIVHALRNEPDAMEARAREAAALSGDDAVIRAMASGMAAGLCSLLNERRDEARHQLDEAMDVALSTPGVPPGMFRSAWAILRSLEGRGGAAAVASAATPGVVMVRVNEGLFGYARAVNAGAAGDAKAAEAHVAAAEMVFDRVEASEGWRHFGRRLAAEAAVRDGWGSPGDWLPDSIAFWTASPFPAMAAACDELLLRATGRRRRGRGDSPVPQQLAVFGVTSREVDVLRYVAAGMSNKETGARLHLSPRTVGSHVSHLLAKLALQRRAQLTPVALEAGLEPPAPRTAPSA